MSIEVRLNNLLRFKMMGVMIYCWFLFCGLSNYFVKVLVVDLMKKNKMLEIDVSEEYCKFYCWK